VIHAQFSSKLDDLLGISRELAWIASEQYIPSENIGLRSISVTEEAVGTFKENLALFQNSIGV